MRLRRRFGQKVTRGMVATLGVVVAANAASMAFAGIRQDQVIHACYKKDGTGTLRIPSGGEACKPNETALDWNQVGPQGPQGTQGPEGPQGPQGPPGPGLGDLQVVEQLSDLDSSNTKVLVAFCPSGTVAVGGGAGVGGPDQVALAESDFYLDDSGNRVGWLARGVEVVPIPYPWMVVAHALCIPA